MLQADNDCNSNLEEWSRRWGRGVFKRNLLRFLFILDWNVSYIIVHILFIPYRAFLYSFGSFYLLLNKNVLSHLKKENSFTAWNTTSLHTQGFVLSVVIPTCAQPFLIGNWSHYKSQISHQSHQTPLTKTVVLSCRTPESRVYCCLNWLVSLCYCVTSVNLNCPVTCYR